MLGVLIDQCLKMLLRRFKYGSANTLVMLDVLFVMKYRNGNSFNDTVLVVNWCNMHGFLQQYTNIAIQFKLATIKTH